MIARLHVDINEHIATVRLNRPDKNNAIDFAMFDAFIEIGRTLSADRTIRAIVLHGAGDHFCAGIDLSAFQGEGSESERVSRRMVHHVRSIRAN